MKKLLLKYRMFAGAAVFVSAVGYLSGCCCPCYYLPYDYLIEAPVAPRTLPDMKDFKAPQLETKAQAVNY